MRAIAEIPERLRRFLDEVRDDFWAHDYEVGGDANDLLISVERVLARHPEFTALDLLRDIWDLGLTLHLDSGDPDVTGIVQGHDTLKGILDDLLSHVVRQVLYDEHRPDGQDGPLIREDKRRTEMQTRELDERYGPLDQ